MPDILASLTEMEGRLHTAHAAAKGGKNDAALVEAVQCLQEIRGVTELLVRAMRGDEHAARQLAGEDE